jgi:hypothetical protein
VASVVAVLLWFFTYRFLFHRRLFSLLPGDGTFRYMNPAQPLQALQIRRSSLIGRSTENKVKTFLGMPLNPLRTSATSEDGANFKLATATDGQFSTR